MKKIFFIVFFLGLTTASSFAQKFNTLSKEDKVFFKEKAEQKIKELANIFGKIPHFPKGSGVRESLIQSCKKNFTDSATIQIGNIKEGKLIKSAPIPIEEYLRNKIKPSRYKVVDVSFLSFKINDIKPLPGELNKYYVDFEFVQQWCGSIDGKVISEGIMKFDYCDTTTKKGRFILEKVNTVLGSKWRLFFDTISVVNVKTISQ